MGWIGPKTSETELAIPADLLEKGFRALFELDLDEYPNHYIYWNPERGEWQEGAASIAAEDSEASPDPPLGQEMGQEPPQTPADLDLAKTA
jgi:hypothetical protein